MLNLLRGLKARYAFALISLLALSCVSQGAFSQMKADGLLGMALAVAKAAPAGDGTSQRVSGVNYSTGDYPLAFLVADSSDGDAVGVLIGFDAGDFAAREITEMGELIQELLDLETEEAGDSVSVFSTNSLQQRFGDALGTHNFIVSGWIDSNLDDYVQVLVDRVANPVGGSNLRLQLVLWRSSSSSLYFGAIEVNESLATLLEGGF